MQRCPSCGEENPDRFRLCGFCGTALQAQLPPVETRRTVTVVFCDLKGSTALAERLDSESLRGVLSHYFERMQAILAHHGGSVEKYIGDAIMAVFGIPRAHEDDALRAVRAADDMRRALSEVNVDLQARWGVQLGNRTGVNTGEVVAGDITVGQRLVTGDTVNVAARLEQAAPDDEVLISATTYRLVRPFVEVERLEPLELKGKAQRVEAFRLVSVEPAEGGIARNLEVPIVGRMVELAGLASAWDRTRQQRRGRLVTVVGDAGVGKSRLIHQFAQGLTQDDDLRSAGATPSVLRARCLSYGEGITFLPLVEVVRQAAEILPDDVPDDARAKVAALAPDEQVNDRLAAMVGLASEAYPVEETFWAARKLFESLARRAPLVLVFDDIHWAEPTFLMLIEDLVRTVQDAAVLIVCSTRHDLLEHHPEWSTGEGMELIALQPLSAEESGQVVANLLGAAPIAADIRDRIVAASEGNPLFVEQMLSMFVDEGLLQQGPDGRWEMTSEMGTFSVPAGISALLAARLDRLGGEDRAVIERGSVVGQLFYRGAVVALSPEPLRDLVGASLSSLSSKQMIRPDVSDLVGEEAHRFHHGLIRDAAYHGLLKRVRIDFHEAVAEWLEAEASSLVEFEEMVGFHLEQAFRYRAEIGVIDDAARKVGHRSAQRLASAGRRAFARGDMPAAVNLLQRAVAVLDADDPLAGAIAPDLGEALDAQGEFGRADLVLSAAMESAVRRGDQGQEQEAAVVRALVRNATGPRRPASESMEQAEAAIPVLTEARNFTGLARAWRLIAFVHGTAGRYGAAQDALDRVIEHARSAGDRRQESRSLPNYGWCAVYGPMPVPEAIDRCEQLLGEATGDRRSESLLGCALGQLRAMRGEFDEARRLVRGARAILSDLGERVLASSRSLDLARIELMAEDPEAAEEALRSDYRSLDAMGERYFLSGVAGLLAHTLHLKGDDAEAEAFSRVSEAWGEEDAEDQALWRRARAKIHARSGRVDEAVALGREAVDLVAATDSPVLQANTMMDLADVLRASGRSAQALPLVIEARSLFERKGSVVSAQRAAEQQRGIEGDLVTAGSSGKDRPSGPPAGGDGGLP